MAGSGTKINLQLAFQNKKAKNGPVIYRGTDPSLNQLILQVSNEGGSLKLKAGEILPETDFGKNGTSAFYLSFGKLLDLEGLKALQSSKDWKTEVFSSPRPTLAISPVSDMTFAGGESLSIPINHLQTEKSTAYVTFAVDYLNMGGPKGAGSFEDKIHLLNPPVPGKKDLVLNANFLDGSGSEVFITTDPNSPISNQLGFYLSNSDPNNPIVTPHGKVGGQFVFTFVYADGGLQSYGALTSVNQAQDIQLNLPNSFGNDWESSKSVQGSSPVWFLKPKSPQLFGTGPEASLSLLFSGIKTSLQPGLTPMYLQYTGIPGYNDGFVTFPLIQKVLPKPSIFFQALPSNLSFGDSVDLYWTGVEVSRVMLEYEELNAEGLKVNKTLDSHLNQIPLSTAGMNIYPKESTTYTLRAYDLDGNGLGEIQRQVTVTPPPAAEVSFSFVQASSSGRFVRDGQGKISCFNPTGPVILQWSIKNALGASLSPGSSPLVEKAGEPGTFIGKQTFDPETGKDTFPNTTFTLTVKGIDSNQYPFTQVETLHIYNVMANPIGSIIAYSGTTDPEADKFTGAEWKICDGRALQISEYSELHGFIGNSYGDGTQPGGNSAGLFFNIPDFRGQFLRGMDANKGLDPDSNQREAMQSGGNVGDRIGSIQGFGLQSHLHNIQIGGDRTLWPSGGTGNTSGKVGQTAKDNDFLGNPNMHTDDTGGKETRPVNAYVSFIIRVK